MILIGALSAGAVGVAVYLLVGLKVYLEMKAAASAPTGQHINNLRRVELPHQMIQMTQMTQMTQE